MTYLENSRRVLLAVSTSITLGITPASAAGIRVPTQPGNALNLADLTYIPLNRPGQLQGSRIPVAGGCDDEEPESEPLLESEASFSAPISRGNPTLAEDPPVVLVRCHDVERTVPFGPETEGNIIDGLEAANADCGLLANGFQIDCLAAKYEKIALSLSNTRDEAIIKSALNKAARDLRQIVRTNADPAVPKTRFAVKTPDGGTKRVASRPLTAVKPSAQPQANAAAAVVIDELNTTLLRSAANSERRQVSFSNIAMAVDSNKVLLRS